MDVPNLLRTEVGLLRRRETRRVFDTVVHVGTLGGECDSFVVRAADLPVVDTALRTEVVASLVDRADATARMLWLTRPGVPEPYDDDLAWLAAAGTAFAMHGRTLDGCYVVTRYGWRDVRTGEARTWRRLRLPTAAG